MPIADQAALAPEPSASPVPEKPIKHSVSRSQRLAGLVIVLAVAFLPSISSSVHRVSKQPIANLADAEVHYGYLNLLAKQVISLALLAYVVRQNGQKFSELGLAFRVSDIFHGLLLWGGAGFCYRLAYPTILSTCQLLGWHPVAPYLPSLQLGLGLLTYVFIVVNPVFEEMIVRAFFMSEILALTGSSVLAISFSLLLQTSYHLYQGIPYALAVGVTFLVFSIYYARTRRIAPVILAHFITNLFAHVSHALLQARAGHS